MPPRPSRIADRRGQSTSSRAQRTCSVPGCDRPHKGKGFCQSHYDRMRNSGAIDLAIDRVARIDLTDPDATDTPRSSGSASVGTALDAIGATIDYWHRATGSDECVVLARVVARLAKGLPEYGPLDLAAKTDSALRRDVGEELDDAATYLLMIAARAQR